VIRWCALVVLLLAASASAQTSPHPDARICGAPVRDADGRIHRSSTVLRAFQIIHPCPSTGSRTGACPGWAIDHVLPLACGGCDSIENLQWLKNSIKSCPGAECKDRWERKINCQPGVIVQ
jgi:hypothetical protein